MNRVDAIGFFWQDVQAVEKGRKVYRVQPDIPETGWVTPREFPRLGAAPYISLDTETFDPGLLERGPGWARGEGHIVGVSISVPEHNWYFPVRHEICPEQNLDPAHVFAWLRDELANPYQPKIGANIMYDLGWLTEENVWVAGKTYDVQFAQALLNERGNVNLEELGLNWLGRGKETSVLYCWLSDFYGGPPDSSQRKNIYRAPPSLVGPYAEHDTALPAQILPLQWAELYKQNLLELFEMETDLIPLLIAMRRAGVTVDIDRAERVRGEMIKRVSGLNDQLKDMVGFSVNVNASENISKAFRQLGVKIPLHFKTGKPCFSKDTLPLVEHPVADLILKIRKYDKLRSTFIESAILEKHHNGKLHCQFNPLRGDESGTRSGRFSGSNPNLQQVPSRDEELAPLVRDIFVPDAGHQRWRRFDYDQVEYRFLANYAVGPGSNELRAQYNRDPKTDYHINAQKLITDFTRVTIPRKPVKNFNFGMTYGMGKDKMIRSVLGELMKIGGDFSLNGEELYVAYHAALPFARETLDHYSEIAKTVGFVTTIMGRRSRFDLWEPDIRRRKDDDITVSPALPREAALRIYGHKIRRAYTHKGLNRVLQGSSADLLKKAMVTLWKSGVYSVIGVPRLTVHDELDHSDHGGDEEAWRWVHHILETSLPTKIPIRAALSFGRTWGEST